MDRAESFHLRVAEAEYIYYIDENLYMKIILLLAFASLSVTCFAQKAKIHGVITYFFNDFQGDKPDLGAHVYAVDSTKCPNYSKEISFQYDLATIGGPKSDTAFKSLDLRSARNNNEIKNSTFVNSATVDGAGNYSLELPAGTYYVLIQSKGRTASTMTELMGKITLLTIRVNADQSLDFSHYFSLK